MNKVDLTEIEIDFQNKFNFFSLMSKAFIGMALLTSILFEVMGYSNISIYPFMFAITNFSLWMILKKYNQLALCSNLLMLAMTATIFLMTYSSGGVVNPVAFYFLLIPIFSVFLLGLRSGLVWLGITVASYGLMWLLERQGHQIPQIIAFENTPMIYYLVNLTINMSLFFVAVSFYKAQQKAFKIIKDSHKDLAQAKKMMALGQMASGVAHEICNPLTIISGNISKNLVLFENNKMTECLYRDSSNKMIKNINRISEIVQSLQDYSTITELDTVGISFNEATELAIDNFSEEIQKNNIKVVFIPLNKDIFTRLKKRDIVEAISCLLENSVAAVMEASKREINIELINTLFEKTVKIKIEDSGKPIGKDKTEQLFQPFFSTKLKNKASGMGLNVAQGIVSSVDGKVYFKKETKLTTFVLEFPLKKTIIKKAA